MTREDMANGLNATDPRDDMGHPRPHAQEFLDRVAAELRKTCEWKADEDGIFQTECGHSFYFDGDGGPTEHQQKFCGYCGGSLIEGKP